MNELIFNENYWDCECERKFIHPITQKECSTCKALQEDQPPSRQNEIDCKIDVVDESTDTFTDLFGEVLI